MAVLEDLLQGQLEATVCLCRVDQGGSSGSQEMEGSEAQQHHAGELCVPA